MIDDYRQRAEDLGYDSQMNSLSEQTRTDADGNTYTQHSPELEQSVGIDDSMWSKGTTELDRLHTVHDAVDLLEDMTTAETEITQHEDYTSDMGKKFLNIREYTAELVGSYLDAHFDSGLWRERPEQVKTFLDDDIVSEAIDAYTAVPRVVSGSWQYEEHLSAEAADSARDYLDHLEQTEFHPI